jgi:hypothetical protein
VSGAPEPLYQELPNHYDLYAALAHPHQYETAVTGEAHYDLADEENFFGFDVHIKKPSKKRATRDINMYDIASPEPEYGTESDPDYAIASPTAVYASTYARASGDQHSQHAPHYDTASRVSEGLYYSLANDSRHTSVTAHYDLATPEEHEAPLYHKASLPAVHPSSNRNNPRSIYDLASSKVADSDPEYAIASPVAEYGVLGRAAYALASDVTQEPQYALADADA